MSQSLDYEICELSLESPSVREKVAALCQRAFKTAVSSERVRASTGIESSVAPSFYLGAMKDGELIGFNAFMSHDLLFNGTIANAYQSCWSASDPAHRGKRIFANLVEAAKERLVARGASFMFGFPDEASRPVFVDELGFREIAQVKINVPVAGPVPRLFLRRWAESADLYLENAYLQNDAQLIAHKRREGRGNIVVVEHYHNLIWGRVQQRRIGAFPLRFFCAGGMIVNNPQFFRILLGKVFREHRVLYVQLVMPPSNRYSALFRRMESAPTTEPLMVFDLNAKTDASTTFNFMLGLKDVF